MSNRLLLASAMLASLALAGCGKKDEAPAEAPPAAEAAPAADAAPMTEPAAEAAPAADAMAPAADTAAPAAAAETGDDRTNPVSRGGRQ